MVVQMTKRLRRAVTLPIVIVGIGSFLVSCTAATGEGGLEITLAVETSAGDPLHDTLATFADELENELGDEASVRFLAGGATGNEEAILQGTRAGEFDVAAVSGSVAALDPTFNIMEIPFLFEDRQEAGEFLDGEYGEEMSQSLQEVAGLSVLGFGENGFRHITTNSGPIESPEDLAGQQIRTPGSPERVRVFEELGASPQQIDIDETYLALEQGVLDGQENPLIVIDAFSFYEKQDYLALTYHNYSPVYLVINEENFSEFPENVRQGMREAAQAAALDSRQSGEEADAELLADFEAAGMTVTEPDLEPFIEQVADIRKKIAEEIPGGLGARVLAEYGE